MADLDDFFAKKDRKKSKGTKKFSTTEEVAKKLEDTTAKKNEKPQKKDRQEVDDTGAPVHVSLVAFFTLGWREAALEMC